MGYHAYLAMRQLRAPAHLEIQRILTPLPKRHKTMRHARRLCKIEAAFFPRSLSVILDLIRQQWGRINDTVGVSSLSMRGGQPHRVPRGNVAALIAFSNAGGILQLGEQLKLGWPGRGDGGTLRRAACHPGEHERCSRVRGLLAILG